ncbi:sensory box protein [Anoxybacillus sp. B7M1]|jgi:PAS domain S-box-containing protein|uniref:sigma 54-interacting transcriptional regulator n=1 Tax=Anoxybacillaceae TaxID=3120669 RepID=UPI0005CDB1ED|nr:MULTISPECIES: sigma-54-dependent Fis family transcriptional regulator [Anoxybacillus]ANB56434.1 sensory box protein [Anoxybacillus sp. B2M1]ANB62821.1 sensory box protein [Anoxybacillus sp. B7M1]KXG11203.1 Arginine utilization regulatory protein RocR [Anoxybacillus sp. P3H1B]QHC04695.1 sigma-54-dependent Fis family transcriptional regulator [Anoxybacillus sp. PDR2]
MKKALIVGASKGGTALLKIFQETAIVEIVAVIDRDDKAPGLELAKRMNIRTGNDWRPFLTDDIDIVVEATGEKDVFAEISQKRKKNTLVIPGEVAYVIAELVEEKEALISTLKSETARLDLILNSTHDGMIVVDEFAYITHMNDSAAAMIKVDKQQVIGKHVLEVIPTSQLPRILKTRKTEIHQEQELENGRKIITTRIPMIDESGRLFGALAVFKDVTEVMKLAEEVTNLKDIRMMLEAIIHSSEEAISVVDEHGKGILINPAYTRITGLSEEEVIGKPATADISEGESMHMQVLKTRRPVRGVRMKVGPKSRDVIVNVAPIIVDGMLKGSVGIIHDVSEIQRLTNELNRARQIIRTLEAKYSFDDIIGTSEEMMVAIEQAKLAAKTPVTILLRGESGTGKELFAHAIHNASDRKYNKFIRVNCAAISETLLESELFGYEEGAFSGAKRGGKRGLFEEANNGSIFLDEIGELSANTQAKLLRVLQEREIVRVGGTKPIPINVRVIAATNVNLEKAIAEGTFREDLYYRLSRMPIHIPPLRARKQDIVALCRHLIHKLNQDYGRNVEGLTEEAIRYLLSYDWPGNVRELENVLGRAMIFMKFNEVLIDVHHIPPLQMPQNKALAEEPTFASSIGPLDEMLEKYEAQLIEAALLEHQGNKTATAKALGISIRSLYYKLEKYDLAKKYTQ